MQDREPGTDALCFTAGPKGIPFSAGVIHAWLAADRAAPKVAAGISSGALAAAAIERACRQRDSAGSPDQQEASRWIWFRRYVNAITYDPLNAIWDAIPNPVDFFAEKPPVKDLSISSLPKRYHAEEELARRHYYRLVKIGIWLGRLRITVRDVARCVIARVRYRERYAVWRWQFVRFQLCRVKILSKVLLQLCLRPQFVFEREASEEESAPQPRPLFGWIPWLIATVLTVNASYVLIWVAAKIAYRLSGWSVARQVWDEFLKYIPFSWLAPRLTDYLGPAGRGDYALGVVVGVGVAALLAALTFRDEILQRLSTQIGVQESLLSPYALRRRIFEVFRDPASPDHDPVILDPPQGSTHLLIVAAPLEKVDDRHGRQTWFRPKDSLVDALTAAMAIPGLFPPVRSHVKKKNRTYYVRLIDGSLVRQNPLPALFDWLKVHPGIAPVLCGKTPEDPSVHLVYNVPVQPAANGASEPQERVDIVTAAFNSLELAQRRDSRMEFRQTNFISKLEWAARSGPGDVLEGIVDPLMVKLRHEEDIWPIFADEIAPAEEIRFPDGLAPKRERLLAIAAEGCRCTLETLYPRRLADIAAREGNAETVHCLRLLSEIAPQRSPFMTLEAPGLPEICHKCPGILRATHAAEPGPASVPLPEFQHLARPMPPPEKPPNPRIVFLAAGGVFRGAFHIGVIGAMQAAKIRPDLVVGASVGTLMGGALAAIATAPNHSSLLIGRLALTFLHVDDRVALTKTLKNAAKHLGTRAAGIQLSPASVRRSVRRGARADAGYAVTGAPPELIDALSTLFLIPHGDTKHIAAEFVAGHVTTAMMQFWKKVREETLVRLEIESALIGTSLLEDTARELLGHPHTPLERRQPYHAKNGPVSVFGTASDLNDARGLVLPRDLPDNGGYNFLEASLASSAFPVVFAPRQQADILPGRGVTDRLYADGGMFDNLPFFPAIEILSSAQAQHRPTTGRTAPEALSDRLASPDLFLAASLESVPAEETALNNFLDIYKHAAKLNVNMKLNSFCRNAELIAGQTYAMLQSWKGCALPRKIEALMDEIVPAAVLTVSPTDARHLNKTFAFCRATGLEQETVALSIADGCYQTLRSLAVAQDPKSTPSEFTHISINALRHAGRIPDITPMQPDRRSRTQCGFFEISGQRFDCPFAQASTHYKGDESRELLSLFQTCLHDKTHK